MNQTFKINDQAYPIKGIRKPYIQSALRSVRLGDLSGPICTCNDHRLELVVVKRGDYHFLRRLPNTGHMHNNHCCFYSDDPRYSPLNCYTGSAVRDGENITSVKTNFPLSSKVISPLKVEKTFHEGESHYRQSLATIKGLLDLMLEKANINKWSAKFEGERSRSRVQYWVAESAKQMTLNNKPLSDHLFVPDGHYKKAASEMQSFMRGLGKGKLGLAFGEVHSIYQSKYSWALELVGLGKALYFADSEIYEKAIKSYPYLQELLTKDANDRDCHLFCLAYIEPKGVNGIVHRLAFIRLTHESFIPFESSYEKTLAEHLVSEGRDFIKPMRFEPENLSYFPDFILNDTNGGAENPTVIEVWGMNDDAYRLHAKKKIDYYNNENITLWQWDAANNSIIPDLPAKAGETK